MVAVSRKARSYGMMVREGQPLRGFKAMRMGSRRTGRWEEVS